MKGCSADREHLLPNLRIEASCRKQAMSIGSVVDFGLKVPTWETL